MEDLIENGLWPDYRKKKERKNATGKGKKSSSVKDKQKENQQPNKEAEATAASINVSAEAPDAHEADHTPKEDADQFQIELDESEKFLDELWNETGNVQGQDKAQSSNHQGTKKNNNKVQREVPAEIREAQTADEVVGSPVNTGQVIVQKRQTDKWNFSHWREQTMRI